MTAPVADLRAICKRVLERCIEAERQCPDEMRARIDIAYRDGWLSDDERAVWLKLCELEGA